jgi:hypothetical protein
MAQCKYCSETVDKKYELCKEHYYDAEDGIIDECKCGRYKDVEFDLCRDCYKALRSNGDSHQRKQRISDSNIKGRLAEAIVEEMFLSMGYQVFRFGMENTVPGFGDRLLSKTGPVAEQVRNMPDFIVVKDSRIAFIEVKYRTNGDFDFYDYYRTRGKYPYPNAYFILITPNHIKIQKAEKLEAGQDFVYLGSHPDFITDKEIILQYKEFCNKFFGNC